MEVIYAGIVLFFLWVVLDLNFHQIWLESVLQK